MLGGIPTHGLVLLSVKMTPSLLDVLISPTTRCNLRCRYCYVDDSCAGRERDMSLSDIAAAYRWLRTYAHEIKTSVIRFTWFGGEPTLKGAAFLKSALDAQRNEFPDIEIANTIQTNLTLVGEDWLPVFKEYFPSGVGGSFDFCETWRTFANGSPTRSCAEKNIRYLLLNGVKVGVVCTLTRDDIGHASEIYRYFKGLGVSFRVNRAASYPALRETGRQLTVEEYDDLANQIAEVYLSDPQPTIDFRNTSLMASAWLQGKPVRCIDVRHPEFFIGLEGGGRVTSRCRFVPSVGNYLNQSPGELVKLFRSMATAPTRPGECVDCAYWGDLCQGGCIGEPSCDCLSSDCGYRTETTCGTWRFIEEYLLARGYSRGCIEECEA